MTQEEIQKKAEEARKKIHIISEIWQDFVWDFPLVQRQINFNQETKTSYVSDIITYFDDTLHILSQSCPQNQKEKIVFTSGTLQIIYAHQDLISELLYLFKFQDSIATDDPNRKINRDLRNELIGHPVKRQPRSKLLLSTVFLRPRSGPEVEYVLYSNIDDFKGKIITHTFEDIFTRHVLFLNTYLNMILKKAKQILKLFRSSLTQFKATITHNIPFSKKVDLIFSVFPPIRFENHLYQKEILTDLFRKRKTHIRYDRAFREFSRELLRHVNAKIRETREVFRGDNLTVIDEIPEAPLFSSDLNFIIVNGPPPDKRRINNYGYELGKLHGRHPIYNIEYFRREFKRSRKIIAELDNMEENTSSTMEYYTSYEYLRTLVVRLRRKR